MRKRVTTQGGDGDSDDRPRNGYTGSVRGHIDHTVVTDLPGPDELLAAQALPDLSIPADPTPVPPPTPAPLGEEGIPPFSDNREKSALSSLEDLGVLCSPSGYAIVRLGRTLYPWQIAVMDAVEPQGSMVALRTCNESGKTSEVITDLILWHMGTFVNSVTITTAGVYRQIVQQLYPSLRTRVLSLPDAEGWHFGKDFGRSPTGSTLYSFTATEEENAEGYHEQDSPLRFGAGGENPLAEYGVTDEEYGEMTGGGKTSLLIIVDEAKNVSRGIFHSCERCHPTRMLIASSPGSTEGYFYDAFTVAKSRWRRFHVDAKMCPHLWDDAVRRARITDQLETLPASLTDSMVWGNFSFHADGAALVFDPSAVDNAMSGTVPRWGQGERRGAIDLSGGGDEQVFYVRDGNEVTLAGAWHEKDDKRLADSLIRCAEQWHLRPEHIYADGGGLGAVILNELDRRGWRVNRVMFGASARNTRYYLNCRAEMYFELAQRLRRAELRLPNCDILRRQLTFQKYLPSDGALRLVPKQQLPESPDRADTIAMLFYDMPSAKEYVDRKVQLEMVTSKTMDMTDGEWFEQLRSGGARGGSATGLWDV